MIDFYFFSRDNTKNIGIVAYVPYFHSNELKIVTYYYGKIGAIMDEKEFVSDQKNEETVLQCWSSAVINLDVLILYLESFDDLYWKTKDAIDELGKSFRNADEEGKVKLAARIRRAIRRIEGNVSESFGAYLDMCCKQTFYVEWNKLSFDEKRTIVQTYEFSRLNGVPSNTLKRSSRYYVEDIVAKTTGKNIGKVEDLFYDSVANDADLAFVLSEYIFAIDDFLDAESDDALLWKKQFKAEVTRVLGRSSEPLRVEGGDVEPIASMEISDAVEKEGKGSDASYETLSVSSVDEVSCSNADAEVASEDDDSSLEENVVKNKPEGYYPIDERLAENAKRAISFDDYQPMSATNAYRKDVDDARDLAETRKSQVDERARERINRLLESYERKLADWINRRNRAESLCPSIMISGAGGFSQKKHAKKMEQLDSLYRERETIREILTKIGSVGSGGIRSDDADAIEQLQAKLEKLKEAREEMKRANAYLKKKGSWADYDRPDLVKDAYDGRGEPTYFYLSNTLAEIRRVERRLETLKQTADTDFGDGWRFEGGIAKVDKEAGRLQLFFDDRPDEETLTKLKGRGFRWSRKIGAWQRILTPDALWTAKFLGYIPKDWKARSISAEEKEEED